MDNEKVDNEITNLKERVGRVETGLSELSKRFDEAIIGTVKEPGLAHIVRETNLTVKSLDASVRDHQTYIWKFHGWVAAIGFFGGLIVTAAKVFKWL